jgi:hypothetical protein
MGGRLRLLGLRRRAVCRIALRRRRSLRRGLVMAVLLVINGRRSRGGSNRLGRLLVMRRLLRSECLLRYVWAVSRRRLLLSCRLDGTRCPRLRRILRAC